jgi:uncharacterized membrane protein
MIATRILYAIDAMREWDFLELEIQAAQSMLSTVVTASLSFLVFTFTSLLVAIQVASGQLTPRIIATTLLRDNIVRYTVGLFIFTLVLTLSIGNRLEPKGGHQFVIFVSALLGICCFAAFLYLIDYAARLLRPISILTRVGSGGLDVIRAVYPEPTEGPYSPAQERLRLGPPARTILHTGASQIALAVNFRTFVTQAESSNGVVEFVPQIGDFVASGEPLFNLYGGAANIADTNLINAVAFGPERTMEQDPTFAIRIVVDIALRALSAAINDPTTAVLAIDQLHRLLRLVGQRHLRTDETRDRFDNLRVVLQTPNWNDFVNLAFCEIRICGANNMQVVRRLRAMIENLLQTLPTHRHAELKSQLDLLERDIRKHFSYPEDLELAGAGDVKGLGGHSGG